ncbi:hypothetical protein [Mycoplasmopsis arginini]|uniref:hypothetical protein n=1 Tax=Mycoplasmopsis arginini TaxID=2094 RepID=UPI003CFEA6CD
MKKSTKRKILAGLITSAALTSFVALAVFFTKGCNTKKIKDNTEKDEKDDKDKESNPFIERLIKLNRDTDAISKQTNKDNPFTNFENLIDLEKKIVALQAEASELGAEISNSQFSEKDFKNVEFETGKKVIMPQAINENILSEAKDNIIKVAKRYLENELNNSNFSENNKNAYLENIATFRNILQFKDEYQSILKVKEFFASLDSSIYYSTNAKQTILGDFHDINQTNEIVNYIDNYDVITSNKKEYYDAIYQKKQKLMNLLNI